MLKLFEVFVPDNPLNEYANVVEREKSRICHLSTLHCCPSYKITVRRSQEVKSQKTATKYSFPFCGTDAVRESIVR